MAVQTMVQQQFLALQSLVAPGGGDDVSVLENCVGAHRVLVDAAYSSASFLKLDHVSVLLRLPVYLLPMLLRRRRR